jgi:hypothetical protein
MRNQMALGLALVASFLAAPAFGQSFVGEWTATAVTPGGEVSERLSVVRTVDGYTVTAKLVEAAPGQPEAGPGTDIVLDGDRFSYKRTIGTIVITYTGVVSGDKFTGTADLAGTQVPYNGVRLTGGK